MPEQAELQINRRKFVASLGIIGAASSLSPLSSYAAEPQSDLLAENLMKCKPYLQAATPNSMTIRWITTSKCYSWVEYGESEDSLDKKAHQVTEGMVDANTTLQDITLRNLQPDRKYFYKVISKRIEKFTAGKVSYAETEASKVYSFKTYAHNANTVQFAVFNDIHDRPESFPVLSKYKAPGDLDFVLLNGDMFNSLKDGESQIVDHLLNPIADLFATQTPFIFARGNHEARGEYARQLPGYINGQEHKFYYSFQLGPMYVIMLDSGEDKEDDNPAYGGIIQFDDYRMEQKAWLEKEVQKKEFREAKHKVVFVHIPPFYTANKMAHGTVSCRNHWVPILNKAKIGLMICGHTHVYGIHPAVKDLHDFPIVIGGGPQDGKRTIINVQADQKQLKLNMIDDNGKNVGSLTL